MVSSSSSFSRWRMDTDVSNMVSVSTSTSFPSASFSWGTGRSEPRLLDSTASSVGMPATSDRSSNCDSIGAHAGVWDSTRSSATISVACACSICPTRDPTADVESFWLLNAQPIKCSKRVSISSSALRGGYTGSRWRSKRSVKRCMRGVPTATASSRGFRKWLVAKYAVSAWFSAPVIVNSSRSMATHAISLAESSLNLGVSLREAAASLDSSALWPPSSSSDEEESSGCAPGPLPLPPLSSSSSSSASSDDSAPSAALAVSPPVTPTPSSADSDTPLRDNTPRLSCA